MVVEGGVRAVSNARETFLSQGYEDQRAPTGWIPGTRSFRRRGLWGWLPAPALHFTSKNAEVTWILLQGPATSSGCSPAHSEETGGRGHLWALIQL